MLRPALQATWQEQSKDLSLLRRDLDNLRAAKAKKMEAYQLVIYGLPPPGLKSNTPVYSYSLVFRLQHMSCRGCNSRLDLPTGCSGLCDPCYLATKVQIIVKPVSDCQGPRTRPVLGESGDYARVGL